jgi:hypothetical protein
MVAFQNLQNSHFHLALTPLLNLLEICKVTRLTLKGTEAMATVNTQTVWIAVYSALCFLFSQSLCKPQVLTLRTSFCDEISPSLMSSYSLL